MMTRRNLWLLLVALPALLLLSVPQFIGLVYGVAWAAITGFVLLHNTMWIVLKCGRGRRSTAT